MKVLCVLVLAMGLTSLVYAEKKSEKPSEFTFYFWTDQELHPKVEESLSRVLPVVESMNTIPGTEYPPAIGGKVKPADFVASGGDTTGWPAGISIKWWNEAVGKLKYPTRAVAGNHDSGGSFSSNTFYNWLRKDEFVAAHTSENGQPAWKFTPPTPGDMNSGIIPGINYSFKHKGVVFIMWSPCYFSEGAPVGSEYINKFDLKWMELELAKYGKKEPKVVVGHYNYGSIMNKKDVDTIYEKNNVLLHLCGHWENITHWKGGGADWVMDFGCREKGSPSFSVVRISRDKLTLAHYLSQDKKWHGKILVREISARW